MTANSARWYVVQTQPNAESKAVAHLARQGFATYLPRFSKKRRHARRIETVAAPLFPRYLFVKIDMAAQRWRSIYSTIGVSTIVCAGDKPAPVAHEIVETLRQREGEDGLIKLHLRPKFHTGDKIRIVDGAFIDCLGLCEGMSDRDRVTILLDLLGRKVRVQVSAEDVAAA